MWHAMLAATAAVVRMSKHKTNQKIGQLENLALVRPLLLGHMWMLAAKLRPTTLETNQKIGQSENLVKVALLRFLLLGHMSMLATKRRPMLVGREALTKNFEQNEKLPKTLVAPNAVASLEVEMTLPWGGLAAGSGGNHGSYEEPPDVPWWEQKPGSDDSGFTALEPSDLEDFVAWSDAEIARAYAAGEDLPQTREATGFGSQRCGYYTWRNSYKGEVADEATAARASSKAQCKS